MARKIEDPLIPSTSSATDAIPSTDPPNPFTSPATDPLIPSTSFATDPLIPSASPATSSCTPSTSTTDPLIPSTSSTTPSMSSATDPLIPSTASATDPLIPSTASSSMPNSTGSIVNHFCVVLMYLCVGALVFCMNHHSFSGAKTYLIVDAVYFCVVTFCTIGYGDIHPVTPVTKAISCAFVLICVGIVHVILSDAVEDIFNVLVNMIATRGYAGDDVNIFDAENRRIQIRVTFGIGIVLLWIGLGMLVLHLVEDLDWTDLLYASVISVTTIGYGDRTFNTLIGRIFASLWLLLSTLVVERAVICIVEAKRERRRLRIAESVLQRDLTDGDWSVVDVNRNGFISNVEFVIFKLKEMGKIGEGDILPIHNQLRKLDPNNIGRITRVDCL